MKIWAHTATTIDQMCQQVGLRIVSDLPLGDIQTRLAGQQLPDVEFMYKYRAWRKTRNARQDLIQMLALPALPEIIIQVYRRVSQSGGVRGKTLVALERTMVCDADGHWRHVVVYIDMDTATLRHAGESHLWPPEVTLFPFVSEIPSLHTSPHKRGE